MIHITLGCLGFLTIHLADLFSLRKVPGAKPVSWLVGVGLLVYALVGLTASPDKLPLPGWLLYPGAALLVLSLGLLVYSLFINLPFGKTYVSTGSGDRLITSGLYALVRHPGLHWFILLMVSLVLVSRSEMMLVAALVFGGLDLALVLVQDRYIFGRMFADYASYRRTTPMLVPNRRSLAAFLDSMKTARADGRVEEEAR
jgi:protein-S-isoprenylcysteine O-methyltransferase Ste14